MAQIESWFDQDLKKPVKVHHIPGNVFTQDNDGNLIGVRVYDHGEAVTLSGSVSANVIRPDGGTVAVAGTLTGNQASVALPQAAYAYPGMIALVIKLTSGSTVTTLCAVTAIVYRSSTDTIIDPGTIIPDIQALIAAIDEAVDSIPPDYSALSIDNNLNLLYPLSHDNAVRNGLTFTWNADQSCTVTGTTTAGSYCYIFNNASHLPDGIQAGETYYLTYSGKQVYFRLSAYINGAWNVVYTVLESADITIPANAVGLRIQLFQSTAGKTINETVKPFLSKINKTEAQKWTERELIDALGRNTANDLFSVNRLMYIEWHQGRINTSDGSFDLTSQTRIYSDAIDTSNRHDIVVSKIIPLKVYAFTFGANGYIGYSEILESGIYHVGDNVTSVRFMIGATNNSNITTTFANNVFISLPEHAKAIALSEINGDEITLTFTSGYYQRFDDVYQTTGDWGYSTNISCTPGEYIHICKSYAVDWRPVFFFDSNDVCVGFYENNNKNAEIENIVVRAPENASYFVVNTKYSLASSTKAYHIKSCLLRSDGDASLAVRNTMSLTGYKLNTIFKNTKANGALFTLVDDDGRNLTQVTSFHNICATNGIVGCNALATKFIDDMSSSDRETFISTLKGYELEGFQNVLHCYNHDYWESSIKSTMTDAEMFSAITSDLVHGIRDMENYGFINWKHWVVPQGKTDLKMAEPAARNLGFSVAYDVADNTYNRFAPRDRQYHQYSVSRMELYPTDTANPHLTLDLIKEQAQKCAVEGGWLIVCVHFYQTGWAQYDPTFSRVSEMIQYVMNLGFKNVTLSGGWSYWGDIYRMYNLF